MKYFRYSLYKKKRNTSGIITIHCWSWRGMKTKFRYRSFLFSVCRSRLFLSSKGWEWTGWCLSQIHSQKPKPCNGPAYGLNSYFLFSNAIFVDQKKKYTLKLLENSDFSLCFNTSIMDAFFLLKYYGCLIMDISNFRMQCENIELVNFVLS